MRDRLSFKRLRFAKLTDDVQHDLLLLQHTHFRKILPYLYLTLMFGIVSGALAFSSDTSIVLSFFLPIGTGTLCCFRAGWWIVHRNDPINAETMANLVPRTTIVAAALGTVFGIWGAFGWAYEASAFRYYIPAFMALGAFSTAYCLSMMPRTAIYAVISGVLPISVMLIASGNMIDFVLGITIIGSTLFLIGLVIRQYRQLVQLIELQQQVLHMANTDALTGLYNRRAFRDYLDDITQNVGDNQHISVTMLDLDGFKQVNDTHGHATGDALLEQIAQRMAAHISTYAYVARLGGDEFGIIFVDQPALFCEQAVSALKNEIAAPYDIAGNSVKVGVSYGIAHSKGPHFTQPMELIKSADQKLYSMKKRPLNNAQSASPLQHSIAS